MSMGCPAFWISTRRDEPMAWVLCLWIAMLSCHVMADGMVDARSQHHSKKPLIGQRYSNDHDGNAIEDQLEAKLDKASRDRARAVSKNDKDKAQEQLDTFVEVQFIFTSPIKQRHLDTFEQLGGQIDYLYKSASYGWNGKIPLKRLRSLAAVLGSDLVLVEESKPIQAHLDVATSNGRVRPVWAPGFAGSSNGFQWGRFHYHCHCGFRGRSEPSGSAGSMCLLE